MNDNLFKDWMLRADSFRQTASVQEDVEFWIGYERGLRRRHHGENFGTLEEHELWHGILPDEIDVFRRARGEGYRAGYSEADPIELFKAKQHFLTTRELAAAAGVGSSRIRQLAAKIPGGRKLTDGWRFPPVSAVNFVKSLSKGGEDK